MIAQRQTAGTLLAATALASVACVSPAPSLDPTPASSSTSRAVFSTPLDEYVRTDDPLYGYEHLETFEGDGYRAFLLEMTSGSWLTERDVERTAWTHFVTVIVPDDVLHDTALVYVGGGRNKRPAPTEAHPMLAGVAIGARSVVVHLRQVPNQPLLFAGEERGRREDALIAYAWDRFLRGGDVTWLPRLPMTRAVVRAMDTATDFCATPEAGSLRVDRFVVAGASKRGWTTWTTAAVDDRVVGIVPIVIDLLNVVPSFRHHWGAYGFWAPAIGDYVAMGIPEWFDSERFRELLAVTGPYTYRARYTMPKLILNAAGDQFFVPDSSRFYFSELPGEKHLRYVPDTDHSLRGSDAYSSLLAFHRAVAEGSPRPQFTWVFEGEDTIRVMPGPGPSPSRVRAWSATNPEARDFRLETIGAAWESEIVAPGPGGEVVVRVPAPERGFTAFFVELTYPSSGDEPFVLTTEVRVVPDTLPFPPPDETTRRP